MISKTEDQVRDELQKLTNIEVGQLTTFNQLGFNKHDIDNLSDEIIKKFNLNKVLRGPSSEINTLRVIVSHLTLLW